MAYQGHKDATRREQSVTGNQSPTLKPLSMLAPKDRRPLQADNAVLMLPPPLLEYRSPLPLSVPVWVNLSSDNSAEILSRHELPRGSAHRDSRTGLPSRLPVGPTNEQPLDILRWGSTRVPPVPRRVPQLYMYNILVAPHGTLAMHGWLLLT